MVEYYSAVKKVESAGKCVNLEKIITLSHIINSLVNGGTNRDKIKVID